MSSCASGAEGALSKSSTNTSHKLHRSCCAYWPSWLSWKSDMIFWDKNPPDVMLDTLADKTSNASSTVQEGSPSSPLSSFRSVAGIEQEEQKLWSGSHEFVSSLEMPYLQKVTQHYTRQSEDHPRRIIAATQQSVQPPSKSPSNHPNAYHDAKQLRKNNGRYVVYATMSSMSQGVSIPEAFDERMATGISRPIPAMTTRIAAVQSPVRTVQPKVLATPATWTCDCLEGYPDPNLLYYHKERCKVALATQKPFSIPLCSNPSVSTSLAESPVNSTHPGSENLDEQSTQSSTAHSLYRSCWRRSNRLAEAVDAENRLWEEDRVDFFKAVYRARQDNLRTARKYPLINHTPRGLVGH